jgi:Domain of unknown function (DUF4157)
VSPEARLSIAREAHVQRRCACGGIVGPGGECAACKAKRLQRQAAATHDVLRSPGRPLEPDVRGEMEARFGHDFSRVRVHDSDAAETSATAIGARAYTVGADVVFGAGGYRPEAGAGKRLLAHELAHVVQQRDHASSRPMAASIGGIEDPLEDEAEEAAANVENGEPAEIEKRTGEPGTIYRVPLLPPGVDILPPIQGIQQALAAMTASCDHQAALTWADFTAAPPRGSQFSAETHFHFELGDAGGHRIVKAIFDPATSWVKPQFANAGDRAQNDCASKVGNCERHFDREARLHHVGVTWGPLRPARGCAASVAPDATAIATTRDECDTVIGAECDRVAQLESDRLLAHEQGHYDLACALARKGTDETMGGAAADAMLAAVRRFAGSQTTLYDRQAAHGCNPGKQADWERDIRAGLPAVDLAAPPPGRRRR